METRVRAGAEEELVHIMVGTVSLEGNLVIPGGATSIVLFAHGSGSSRHSPRNRYVARELQEAGFATLLFDLLTSDEDVVDQFTARLRFDIPLLARRLVRATDWLAARPDTQELKVGYFGASTGAAAALIAAAERPDMVGAVVSRGGRPDLAGGALSRVKAPTLLIVGGDDAQVLALNHGVLPNLPRAQASRLEVVPGATHLFEEPGALEEVARLACGWFQRYLAKATGPAEGKRTD